MVRRGKGRWTLPVRALTGRALGATLAILLVAPTAAGMQAEESSSLRTEVECVIAPGVINASAHGILDVHTSGSGQQVNPQPLDGQRVRLGSTEATITLPSSWTDFFYALGARGAGGTVKSLGVNLGGETVNIAAPSWSPEGLSYSTSVGRGNRLEIVVRSFGYFSSSPIANAVHAIETGQINRDGTRGFTENGTGSYTSTGSGIIFTLNGYEGGGARVLGEVPIVCTELGPPSHGGEGATGGSGPEGTESEGGGSEGAETEGGGSEGAEGVGGEGGSGPSGSTGPTGPGSETEAPGPTGATGVTGGEAPTGTSGVSGETGASGVSGETGASGVGGPTGAEGSSGPKGITAPTGPSEPSGPTGVTAPAGGETGATGPSGTTGATGGEGSGVTGETGATGPTEPPTTTTSTSTSTTTHTTTHTTVTTTSTASPPGTPSPVPFAADSPWNTPIVANPALDPNSSAMSSFLGSELKGYADLYEFGTPVFEASASDPFASVSCTEPWGLCQLTQQLIQIPTGASPASGSDSSMVVTNGSTGYDFWNAHRNSATSWSTGWGTRFSLTGSGTGGGATGAGMPTLAGLVRTSEMEHGQIDHALAFITSNTCASVYRYPASKTDGRSGTSNCIPEGTRIQLDPSIDVDAIPGITPGERIVAHALQTYGAYCRDTGGAKLAIAFEDPVGKPNPYPSLGFPWDFYDMPHIPWNGLRVLQQWNGE